MMRMFAFWKRWGKLFEVGMGNAEWGLFRFGIWDCGFQIFVRKTFDFGFRISDFGFLKGKLLILNLCRTPCA